MVFFARTEITATAGQTLLPFAFPFLDSTHIGVTVNGGVTTAFTVTSAVLITMDAGLTVNDAVVIRRVTPHTALVAFTGGVPVTLENMETQRKQFTYINEEASDDFAVPIVAVQTGPLIRFRMSTGVNLNLDAGAWESNDANTLPPFDTLDTVRNSPIKAAISGSSILLGPGVWSLTVRGQLERTNSTAGAVVVRWDMVDVTTGDVIQNVSLTDIHMGPALTVALPDPTTVCFGGTKMISTAGNIFLRLRMAKTIGAAQVTSANTYISAIRYGS